MMQTDRKALRNPDVRVSQFGEELFLHDREGEFVHVLNPTAAVVWDCCDGTRSVADMEAALRNSFAIPPERDVAGDVHAILVRMEEKTLISFAEEQDGA